MKNRDFKRENQILKIISTLVIIWENHNPTRNSGIIVSCVEDLLSWLQANIMKKEGDLDQNSTFIS